MRATRQKLKNGLSTVIVELPDSQVVSTSLFTGAGARYEDQGTYGISHFLEHMVFKGTKKFPTAEIYANTIESIGGQQNAWTDTDNTNYYNVVPKEHRKVAFEAIFEQVQEPLIKEGDINKERGVILEEANMVRDNPSVLVWDKLGEILWPNQPLGSDILGPKENIKCFKRQDFMDYKSKHYKAENMALAVAGGIKTEETLPVLENIFGKLEAGEYKKPVAVYDDQNDLRVETIYKDIDQANLIVAYKGFSFFDPRKVTLDLLSTILGSGMGSILFREVREKRGLAYRIDCHPAYYSETGFLAVYAGLNKDKVDDAVKTIKSELFKTKDKPIRPKDIYRAKEFLKGSYKIQLETANSISNWYGKRELLNPGSPDPSGVIQQIDEVTEDDLRAVSDEVFSENKESLIVVGPYKDKKRFEKAIKI